MIEEAKEESNTKKPHLTITQSTKRVKKNQWKALGPVKNQQTTTKKSIQWKDTKTIQQFPPQYPVASSFIQHMPANPFMVQSDTTKPPLFPPPPPPQLSLHPFYAQSPLQSQFGYQNGLAPQTLPIQQMYPNPFQKQFQPSNPFPNLGHNPGSSVGKNPFQKQWNPFNSSN
jgi:hypothetical protein